MSINNFSSNNPDTTPCWAQEQQQLKNTPSIGMTTSQLSWLHSQDSSSMHHNCLTNEDTEAETRHSHQEHHPQQVQEFHKKTMFEKPLTPSDVGKLNRLVIPKQHAEKHFPLGGDSIDKGLLLSFEDELGKSWRFRYSYWNSSQSYVLTKGWSRYVKEKGLDAGDVVFFARHRTDPDRLFIGWRRRGTASSATPQDGGVAAANSSSGGDGGWSRMMVRAGQGHPYPRHHHGYGHGAHVPYQSDSMHAGGSVMQQHQTAAATTGNSSSKTLRLFGVNLECQLEESEPSTPDSSSFSSQSQGQAYHQMQQYNYSQPYYYSTSHQSHMDMNFCEDVKQMKDHRG